MSFQTETRNDTATSGVRVPPPFIYAAGFVAGVVLDSLLPSIGLGRSVTAVLGGVLLLAGAVLALSFFTAFRRAHTAVDLRQPTTALVTGGPFARTRNPGYLSLALIFAGAALVLDVLWAIPVLVAVVLIVDRAVIRREERYLENRFGDRYRAYRASTRRWV